jgi:hypothetical protein
MAFKVRGGVMSTNGVAAIEVDMRDLLRARKAVSPDVTKKPDSD